MPTITVAGLQNLNNAAVLKFQVGAMLVADESASILTAPFDGTGALQAFPAGYVSAGLTDAGGLNVGRAITVADVASWQTVQPVRTDVTADKMTLKVKVQETNKVTLAIQEGKLLADVDMTGKSFGALRSSAGRQPKRRVILLAEDQANSIIVVRSLPNARLTAYGSDASYQRATELMYDYQLDAYPDPLLLDDDGNPTDSQFWIGGAGFASLSQTVTAPPAWQSTTAYALNATVTLSTGGGGTVKATTAGTSGSTQPVLPASVGGTVTDGTVVWTRLT